MFEDIVVAYLTGLYVSAILIGTDKSNGFPATLKAMVVLAWPFITTLMLWEAIKKLIDHK
jgi:hypothetical protein